MPRKLSNTYGAIHQWIRLNWGYAKKCEHCRTTKGRLTWAMRSDRLSRDRKDWLELCYSCHKKYDIQRLGLEAWNKGRKGRQLNHNTSGLVGGGWNRGCRKRSEIKCICGVMFYPPKPSSRFHSKHCAMIGNTRAKLLENKLI